MIVIELRGEVLAKAAPRFAVRGKIAMAYKSAEQLRYHELLRCTAIKVMNDMPPLEGPLHMDYTITIAPPKSFSKKKYNRALAGLEYPAKKPDLTNYAKMIEDPLNRVVYHDDSQIVSHNGRKRYGSPAGVRIEISIV